MKKMTMCLAAALAFCATLAAADEAPLKDERKIGQEAKLKADYGVDDARIRSLRDRKLGFGEINNVLAIAEKMPGGITDENVDKILVLRQGSPVMGWGQIARKQGFALGSVVGKGSQKAAVKGEKPARAEMPVKAQRPEKPVRPEKAERVGRPERGKR